jgi:hypothetical protein
LTIYEKMLRMKRKMRMPMPEKMPPHPLYSCPVEMVPKEEAPMAHEVILADVEPEMP